VEQAKTENKPILLDFTGSDWCGWCMKMKKESLDTPMFKHYAEKNLVLVEVDFPHGKTQPESVKKQNKELSQKYSANGFPTFVLVDKDAKELGRQGGYLEGGPTAFIAKLNTFYKPAPNTTKTSGTDDFDKFFKKPPQTPHP
jgi:thioredoxin-related protein